MHLETIVTVLEAVDNADIIDVTGNSIVFDFSEDKKKQPDVKNLLNNGYKISFKNGNLEVMLPAS